ncbi:gamma-glutamylcyclotransferase family protein [Sinimarinibacterium thermocellulolyticum]|uniref:Putative gamma-glutamylcyclotransferase n=1 Tax=Sinimarinibacterium thermocellulolyticum TaxID=3170016 RepID=A0ABV2A903_9GAMM
MRSLTLFVYGSLLVPAVLRALLDRVPMLAAAELAEHRRCALRGQDFPGLVPASGARTCGAVIAVGVRELAYLDDWESDFFERSAVTVHMTDGSVLAAQAYLLAPAHRHLATTRTWTLHDFARRHASSCARRARIWRRDRDRRLRHTTGPSPRQER